MYDNVTVLNHSSIKITGDTTIYFDPFEIADEPHDADIIFITHDHYDHYSPDDIKKIINDNTIIVVPTGMKDMVTAAFAPNRVKAVYPEGLTELPTMMARATYAYNKLKPFHPKSKKFVGYLITVDKVKYYVAGDTDNLPENHEIKCDVALIPVGGKFTMDYKDAAKFINTIKPKMAIPTHYGKVVGSPEDGKKFAELVSENIEVRVIL